MSKPPFEDMFGWKSGRRNRKSFALFMLAQLGVSLSLFVLIVSLTQLGNANDVVIGITGLGTFVVGVGLITSQFCVMAQRCRDIGYSGFFVLLNFVPFIALLFQVLLLIVPGSKGPNKYGPDPRDPNARADGLTSANTNASLLNK
ncbi:hypothetical protein LCGC14_0044160 [marine sediment metagenome]|uniref:DUF805 domain-containing protein n=2 Tax=root TaxID=1 RepID=A0A7V1BI11_9RHOB|nr:DUF805 domain-containing protein [Sulfitobacter litoralis]HDZ53469.1 DUF805 domain-containing protein [Sulfitobacter litoralis]